MGHSKWFEIDRKWQSFCGRDGKKTERFSGNRGVKLRGTEDLPWRKVRKIGGSNPNLKRSELKTSSLSKRVPEVVSHGEKVRALAGERMKFSGSGTTVLGGPAGNTKKTGKEN